MLSNVSIMITWESCLGKTLYGVLVNFLPNAESLDWSKLNSLADDKINVTEISFGTGKKYYGKNEKMLVTSSFSFSNNFGKHG